MAYVIKRYSNRKLYDTRESRYVTLDEIEAMVRAGTEVSVVDVVTGDDLTTVTLTQIILEGERRHRRSLPAAFLHQLIKDGAAVKAGPDGDRLKDEVAALRERLRTLEERLERRRREAG